MNVGGLNLWHPPCSSKASGGDIMSQIRAFTALMVQALAAVTFSQVASAQVVMDMYQDQGKKLLERMSSTKVAADDPLLQQVVAKLRAGDQLGAAALAQTHPNFLNSTVKLMALKMSTREETIRIPMNDFAAAFMGATRDGLDARLLLTGNFYYMADATKLPAGVTVRSDMAKDILGSDNHYTDLDVPGIDAGSVLKMVNGQQILDGSNAIVANPDPAGVLTSLAFMGAHAIAGTNRRPVQYTFQEFMCTPIQDWADISASDQRIGRDVDRYPGGDPVKFSTTCKGCHSQMDSFRGAFAYWDVTTAGALANSMAGTKVPGGLFDSNKVSTKMNKNNTVFPGGFVMLNNSWVNNSLNAGNAALFGWRGSVAGGNGVNAFATIVSNSQRFSQCMVKRVYDAVCRTNIDMSANAAFLQQYAQQFEASGYNLKTLFQNVAVSSMCTSAGQ